MSRETITLDENDWAEVLKGKNVKIGHKILTVRPFTILELTNIKNIFAGLSKELGKEGFSAETITSEKGLHRIFDYVVSNCPALIEMACGLDRKEVPKLPVSLGLTLMTEIINVNIESHEGLMQALNHLGKMLTP